MSTIEDCSSDESGTANGGSGDMKLEVVVIPVSDVDRAKEFYATLGWRLDADRTGDEFRLSSSRLQAPGARSSSAPTSPRPHPAPLKPCS
jgi:hypothetical protein